MRPLISMIVPVYNGENFIEKCIKSILDQSLKELQIIIVNDGSSDHTADILQKYKKSHSNITVINQENGGPASARNAGLTVAKGEYIIFLTQMIFLSIMLLRLCLPEQ